MAYSTTHTFSQARVYYASVTRHNKLYRPGWNVLISMSWLWSTTFCANHRVIHWPRSVAMRHVSVRGVARNLIWVGINVIAISICPGSRRQNNHIKHFKVDWFGGIYTDIPPPRRYAPGFSPHAWLEWDWTIITLSDIVSCEGHDDEV